MLEEILVVPKTVQRLRTCVLGAHLDEFCSFLVECGYAVPTIRHKFSVLRNLARWMTQEHLAVVDLDERRVDQFIEMRRHLGRSCRGFRFTVLQLIEQLRCAGVIVPTPELVHDDSPSAALMGRYEDYLRQDRGLAESTILAYLPFARELMTERLEAGAALGSLCSDDVGRFLLAQARRLAPKRAQYMACALRSFLRFLFLRGEIGSDLAFAVPAVRRGRLSNVPRHLPGEDVERLLRSCDRSSAKGRRDHAILLLLARLGLRAGEVLALELDDLNWRKGEIVVRGKGSVNDRLPLVPDVGEALAVYLRRDRPTCSSRRVFLCIRAPHRGFAHPSSVSTIVARSLARAGLAPEMRGAHLLRHSLATAMLRRGATLTEIGQVLRHRSANTTEIYAKLDFEALRDVAMPWPVARGAQ